MDAVITPKDDVHLYCKPYHDELKSESIYKRNIVLPKSTTNYTMERERLRNPGSKQKFFSASCKKQVRKRDPRLRNTIHCTPPYYRDTENKSRIFVESKKPSNLSYSHHGRSSDLSSTLPRASHMGATGETPSVGTLPRTGATLPVFHSEHIRTRHPDFRKLPEKNRHSASWRRVKSVNDRASLVLWEISSSIDAVKESGSTLTRNVSKKVFTDAPRKLTLSAKMSDIKLEDLKRSISSWSLSTFKKPVISGPRIRKPNFTVFSKQKVEKKETVPSIEENVAQNSPVKLEQEKTEKKENHSSDNINSPIALDQIQFIDDDDKDSLTASTDGKEKPIVKTIDLNGLPPRTEESLKPSKMVKDIKIRMETDNSAHKKTHTRSSSEIQQQPTSVKPKTKDEIVLNVCQPKPKPKKKSFLRFFIKEKENDKDSVKNENIKRIFGIRRKLSIKPIVDNNMNDYKNEERKSAMTPLAFSISDTMNHVPESTYSSSQNASTNVADSSIDSENDKNTQENSSPVTPIKRQSKMTNLLRNIKGNLYNPNKVSPTREALPISSIELDRRRSCNNDATICAESKTSHDNKNVDNILEDNLNKEKISNDPTEDKSVSIKVNDESKETFIEAEAKNAESQPNNKNTPKGEEIKVNVKSSEENVAQTIDKIPSREQTPKLQEPSISARSSRHSSHSRSSAFIDEIIPEETNDSTDNMDEIVNDDRKFSSDSRTLEPVIKEVIDESEAINQFIEDMVEKIINISNSSENLEAEKNTSKKEHSTHDENDDISKLKKCDDPCNMSPSYQNTIVDSKAEPIYWEIHHPKPNPRKRRQKSDVSEIFPNAPNEHNSQLPRKAVSTMHLPQWIQQRPPIPSPRVKKQASTQSLCHAGTDRQVNLFGSDFDNIDFKSNNSLAEWSGNEFYSGKAASISYGITGISPPPVPLRSKKPSLISLPTSSNEERILIRSSSVNPNNCPIYQKRQKKKLHLKNEVQFPEMNQTTDVLTSVGIGISLSSRDDYLLAEVLFSVYSLVGKGADGSPATWSVPVEKQGNDIITLDQIKSHLQEVFQVSPEKVDNVWEEVKQRKTAEVSIGVKVIGAKGLRPKTVRGGSNPYAIVSLSNFTDSRRTRLEHETLNPTWNQNFSLNVKNLYTETLNVQVWHEHHLVDSEQLAAIRDIRGLTRLVKETNATFAQKQDAHLLGSVKIPLTELKGGTYYQWIPLLKDSPKEAMKDRGSILIEIQVGSTNTCDIETQSSLSALLARLLYFYIKESSNNNAEDLQIPWSGQLSSTSKAIFLQHSIILGLNEDIQNLCWFEIPAKLTSVDNGWLFQRLKKVHDGLKQKLYSKDNLETVSETIASFCKSSLTKLVNLQKAFPPASGIVAKHQLTFMLRIMRKLEEFPQTKEMLEEQKIWNLSEQVREAVSDHTKIWWNKITDEQLRDVALTEEQLKRVTVITGETYYFLYNLAVFYSPVLLSEMKIPFFREAYLLLTSKINPCVRPLLTNIFAKAFESHWQEDQKNFSFETGSQAWQLYINLSKIHQLGQDLPLDIREKSGIFEFHRWFTKGILKFLEIARSKSHHMVKKAVNLDSFEPIDEYCNFSSSATDITGIFIEIRIWWQKLAWPDPENNGILLTKILEDICSCGMVYADLLRNKVDEIFREHIEANKDQLISPRICIGLNNIERVRMELLLLPKQFLVNELGEKIRISATGGQNASNSFRENIETLIESSSENMEGKVTEFIETVIYRMNPTLINAVTKALEEESDESLLRDLLDPSLHLLRDYLDDNNFMRVLKRMWDDIITIFQSLVNSNATKRKPSFFGNVQDILEKILKFFSPSTGIGLSSEEAHTEEYETLSDLITSLRLSSENLISKYYLERYEEQNFPGIQVTAELVVRMFFTKLGKLSVEVIMAKNIVWENTNPVAKSPVTPVDSYVKVQFVPTEWFPHLVERKTRTMRKSDPAVYEETFEFDLDYNANGISEGHILFTLKDFNIARSNTFIGEALLPFKNVPCVDSSDTFSVRNTFLKLTAPQYESRYKSLLAIKQRTNDRVAVNFYKRIATRFTEQRHRTASLFSHSSDEDKPNHRSPLIGRKFK